MNGSITHAGGAAQELQHQHDGGVVVPSHTSGAGFAEAASTLLLGRLAVDDVENLLLRLARVDLWSAGQGSVFSILRLGFTGVSRS